MNIFYLDHDPKVAAVYHCDKHVVKMIIELAQIMSINHRFLDGNPIKNGRSVTYLMDDPQMEEVLYKVNRLHLYHPSTKWNRLSIDNYKWTFELFKELCNEYQYRYGKIHSVWIRFKDVLINPPNNLSEGKLTKPNYAFSGLKECIVDDPVESYRNYYVTKRHKFNMKWTGRATPSWFIDRIHEE